MPPLSELTDSKFSKYEVKVLFDPLRSILVNSIAPRGFCTNFGKSINNCVSFSELVIAALHNSCVMFRVCIRC